jgi:prepilin-type N-terminal cleavage/methylation domain-containing protein
MKNNKGFTIIELTVVFVIVGILLALVVAQYTGVSYKNKVEADVKTLYSDIVEMKLKSYSGHYDTTLTTLAKEKNYGVYWGADPNWGASSFTTYTKYLFTDVDNNGTIALTEFYATAKEGLPTAVTLSRSMSVSGGTPPVGVMFNGKGIQKSGSAVYIYAPCAECDQSVDPTVGGGKVADQSASCNDVNYPEYSCIAVSLIQVKIGKWCDKNADDAFDPDSDPAVSECSFR